MPRRRFSLIGPGRAGMSLHAALTALGWECAAVFGRGDSVVHAGADVDVCVIAAPDGEIAEVARSIVPCDAVVMHLSGATSLAALAPHARVAGLHPLQSLPNAEVGAASLRQCFFAVAGDDIAAEIAEELSGQFFQIADTDRALYHCTAAIASNHSVALLGQVERLAEAIGVPFEAFESLVATSVANAFAQGSAAALTGPAARGEEGTLNAHRAALAADHPDELASYEALVELAKRLAT